MPPEEPTTEGKRLKISLLVPCYNEEKLLEATIRSCLNQTRKFDELVFIDDSSSDRTPEILERYKDRVVARRTPKNTGNKSGAQEFGLQFVTGDIFVMTDADTLLDPKFVEEIEKEFDDPKVAAVAGYVKSIPYNWLTLCRAFDYVIGQHVHKIAQDYMHYIVVMPGAACAFRADIFRKYITFDHDTLTEDLDFTYKLHHNYFRIAYTTKAISYTQDPPTLKNYINQMRRWYDGGWQNLMKHYKIVRNPVRALELSLIYAEGMVFSVLLFIVPVLNWWIGLRLLYTYFFASVLYAIFAAWKAKRPALLLAPIPYLLLIFVNAILFLESFVKQVILKRKNLVWFKPERIEMNP